MQPNLAMTYRDLIRNEFLKRKKENPQYSLRSYAKNLGLKPMHLSYLLRNKRGLAKEKAYGIGRAIGLAPQEAEAFRFLVASESGRAKWQRNLAKQGLKRSHISIALQSLTRLFEKDL